MRETFIFKVFKNGEFEHADKEYTPHDKTPEELVEDWNKTHERFKTGYKFELFTNHGV